MITLGRNLPVSLMCLEKRDRAAHSLTWAGLVLEIQRSQGVALRKGYPQHAQQASTHPHGMEATALAFEILPSGRNSLSFRPELREVLLLGKAPLTGQLASPSL